MVEITLLIPNVRYGITIGIQDGLDPQITEQIISSIIGVKDVEYYSVPPRGRDLIVHSTGGAGGMNKRATDLAAKVIVGNAIEMGRDVMDRLKLCPA